MLSEPLPSTLDVRKAALRGATVSGSVRPSDLPRFRSLLADDSGEIEAQLTFSRDDENRYLIHLEAQTQVAVICQRCLEPMVERLSCANKLAVVWTDEEARHLPRQLDPLVVETEECSLWEVVEEELILALPSFSYHDTEQCRELLVKFNADQDAATPPPTPEERNPFEVLATLKPGTKN